ncbi:hypothetical protein PSTG_12140 [Puccinia striiformis f. sp. tritici PST-78]|uniref:Uncharacterized protein n=1 Tax=Puccinia striiformis f. sp. tritici PST-78 TaxID=1165861 RepID=A0A0L0V692_9BASI|nr:hypothetical protein PSTG_12140 [Puccinia striiformis f. sp. tritici PST-78]
MPTGAGVVSTKDDVVSIMDLKFSIFRNNIKRSLAVFCWNLTSDLLSSKRVLSSPLHEPLSKKPRAVGQVDDVTDVITDQDQLSLTATDINNKHSDLLDRIFPPITDLFNPSDC